MASLIISLNIILIVILVVILNVSLRRYLVAGYWPLGDAGESRESKCSPVLNVMAEHVIETDIITVIPTFYNYQDIRTFYTVNTSQTFKVVTLYSPHGRKASLDLCQFFSFSSRRVQSVAVLTSVNAV